MKILKTLFAFLLFGVMSTSLFAQNPYLVKDIYPGAVESRPVGGTGLNGIFYFSSDNGVFGREMWRSDGTDAGTYIVKDIHPNNPTGWGVQMVYNVNNLLYFSGNDGKNGQEPWKSNGTANGTTMIKNIAPSSGSSQPNHWTLSGNIIYFNPCPLNQDWQIWKTDGTSAGTVLIKNINKKGNDAASYFHDVNGTLFFWADNGSTGIELWKSNGTTSGTVMVKEIRPGISSSYPSGFPRPSYYTPVTFDWTKELAVGSIYYFTADDGSNGAELWKSDGTSGGTVMVANINSLAGSYPHWLTQMGNYLYFSANDGTSGYELWSLNLSNGTVSLVSDLNAQSGSYPMQLTVVNDLLYFSADDGVNGRELWRYDAVNPPVAVTNLNGSEKGVYDSTYFRMANVLTYHYRFPSYNGTVFFEANDGTTGWELWQYHPASGVSLVKDINPGMAKSRLEGPCIVDTKLFFTADDGIHGRELWCYDMSQPINAPMVVETMQSDNYKIDFYPNPASESLTISGEFKNNVNLNIKIFDLLGYEIMNTEKSSVSRISEQIDISGYPAGMYIINFRFNGQSVQQKFIKK